MSRETLDVRVKKHGKRGLRWRAYDEQGRFLCCSDRDTTDYDEVYRRVYAILAPRRGFFRRRIRRLTVRKV